MGNRRNLSRAHFIAKLILTKKMTYFSKVRSDQVFEVDRIIVDYIQHDIAHLSKG